FREVMHHSDFAKTRDGGIWLAVLEAAYAHLSKRFINSRRQDEWAQRKYGQYSELSGLYEQHALAVLMSSDSYYINPQLQTQERLREQLNSFVDNEKAATVSINPSVSIHLELRPFAGIKTLHAYSLIGYDKEKDIVYIRDPHGESDAVTNIYTINRHIQPLSSKDSEIFEVILNYPGLPESGLSYGLTKPRLNNFLNQTVPDMMDSVANGIIPSNILGFMPISERSAASTGIIEMTLEQFINTFNFMQISQCEPYQCPNKQ
ncbi:hypothetical protein, partial [Endozoicomonas sp. SESOKO4]